jgi:RNA polymerase sigma factor (sigma-70 family)
MDRPRNSTEAAEWVNRALEGERTAERRLAAWLSPIIRARIARKLRAAGRYDAALVEDLSQELWSQLFDRGRSILAKWNSEGMSLENYVGRAAEWQVNQRLRSDRAVKRRAEIEELSAELPAGIDVEASVANAELARRLLTSLHAELPHFGRLVLELLYCDQLTPADAAAALRVNKQVIFNWQHRIRARARELVRRETEGA